MIQKSSVLFVVISFLMMSCSSSKRVIKSSDKEITKADKIIWTAVSYKGTPYQFGGQTKVGMDCSGLIYTSFKQRGEFLPRTARAMSLEGEKISLNKARRGDLLFFKTNKNRNVINHVGLVTSVKNGIHFIHASSSKGVIVSSLNQNYWKKSFVKAKKVL